MLTGSPIQIVKAISDAANLPIHRDFFFFLVKSVFMSRENLTLCDIEDELMMLNFSELHYN